MAELAVAHASASAKVILLGEHAVVYGQPALAVPVSSLRVYAECRAEAHTPPALVIDAVDLNETITVLPSASQPPAHPLELAARLVLARLDQDAPDARLTLRSEIPIASGLGSGAAIATALARALSTFLGASLPADLLNRIVFSVEGHYHGQPSGIDNTVIVYERPVCFIRGEPIERLQIGAPFRLLIADTGIRASTRASVAHVAELVNGDRDRFQLVLDEIGALVRQARQYLMDGQMQPIGGLMTRNHALLQQLEVSGPALDRLVEAALEAGASGAKLSGGGVGGNMIALVTDDTAVRVRVALESSGAVRIIDTTVDST